MTRTQRRLHVAVWVVLALTIAATVATALVVDAHVERVTATSTASGSR